MGNQLLKTVYKHKDAFIRSFDKISDGVNQYNSVIELIELGDITVDNICDYGFEKEWLEDLN